MHHQEARRCPTHGCRDADGDCGVRTRALAGVPSGRVTVRNLLGGHSLAPVRLALPYRLNTSSHTGRSRMSDHNTGHGPNGLSETGVLGEVGDPVLRAL